MKLFNKKIALFIVTTITAYTSTSCDQKPDFENDKEFYFIAKPSPLDGVGVFAIRNIPAETLLFEFNFRTLKIKDIPTEFQKYCIFINQEECLCPERFDRMEIGYYLNHSDTPNIKGEKIVDEISGKITYIFYAAQNINAGDEVLSNYNDLDEPENLRETF